MATKLNKNDRELLTSLAEYRLLTVSQIAALCAVGKPAARNRLSKLTNAALVKERTPASTRSRGRPERWVSLTERGIGWLRKNGILGRNVPSNEVAADEIRCAEHLLAINSFRIRLVHLEKTLPRLNMTFLSSMSPFLEPGADGQPLVFDRAPAADAGGEPVPFTPDGVFTLRDQESGITLLFFLEVDMGTETLASARRGAKDILNKIVNYQQYFRSGGYKRYQDLRDCELNGFRLLFLAHTPARLAALCRLVHETPPSDFVWLTDRDRMLADGMSAEIWARGGELDAPLASIVGQTMSRVAPLPGRHHQETPATSSPEGRLEQPQTVEQIIARGYFSIPRGDPVTAVVTDRMHTAGLGLDDVISQVRRRYEIHNQILYEIELGKCAAMNAIYHHEAYHGPPSSKQMYAKHKAVRDLYEQEQTERTSLWKDVSRLRTSLAETAQSYLAAHRKSAVLGEAP